MAFLDNNFYGGIGMGGANPYNDGANFGGYQNNNIYGPQPFNNVISMNYQNGGGASNTPSSGVSVSPIINPRPTILTPPSSGGAGVGVAPIDVILNDDVATNDTPIVPAGAYDYGSGKVYSAFTTEDVVEGGTKRVTRGLWSGGSGELTNFFTSSFLSNTQKAYYYEIYNGDPSVSTNEPQFSIAYGHYAGSGSAGTNEDSPSSAIYSQMQQVLLPSNQKFFKFNDTNQDDVYVIAINRARLKDRLDPGNWELCISGSGGNDMLRLLDDSGDTNQAGNARQTKYNIVSGSLTGGIQNSTRHFGEVYPQHGIIVLGAALLDTSASLGTVRTQADNQNHNRLFLAISGAAAANSSNGFQARNEEEVKSTFYFVRAKNGEYNFSNNPTYISGSEGRLNQSTYVGDPKTYITNVGLYNNDNELLAIAKLSKPILKSFQNEVLIKVKLDF